MHTSTIAIENYSGGWFLRNNKGSGSGKTKMLQRKELVYAQNSIVLIIFLLSMQMVSGPTLEIE